MRRPRNAHQELRSELLSQATPQQRCEVLSAAFKARLSKVTVRCQFSPKPVIRSENKDKLSWLTSSIIRYHFYAIFRN